MAIRPISEISAPALPYCILSISASQGYAPGSIPAHTWTSEIADPWNFHAPSGQSIVVDRPGLWYVTIQAVLNVTPAGASTWSASLVKNGSGTQITASTLMSAVGFNYFANCSGPIVLAANDVLTVTSSQNSGATGNFVTSSMFSVYYIGAA